MLVLDCSERWRVERAGFEALCAEVCFLAFVLVFQSHFVNTGSLMFVISFLKLTTIEDFGSKLQLLLIASISISCTLGCNLEIKCSQLRVKLHARFVNSVRRPDSTKYFS
jgi:membrane protein CcdC involved in cytochrome C biogenesis